MPNTLIATVRIALPDDEFDAAEKMLFAKPIYDQFINGLESKGLTISQPSLTVQRGGTSQPQAKRPPTTTSTGKRMGRPPKAASTDPAPTTPTNGANPSAVATTPPPRQPTAPGPQTIPGTAD